MTCGRVEPDHALDLPELPPRLDVRGAEFIEFATRDAEKAQLEHLLATLGFRRVGSHISKALALWQQGEIRIVLNEEATGYANSAWSTRGTNVCDIGIEVGSAADTVARATALGAETFRQPLGPGELDIPAIRGLCGSVLHFLDRSAGLADVWSVEFRSESAAAAPGAGLTRVDHLAQTMSYEEMLSWSLFYTTLFDMAKTPMVDVIDPDGLVRSQALSTPDGSFRITLNGAETHRTLAGGFLADTFGSSIQHIAFQSEDIFATARSLAARGFETLPLPENYYADLEARFDLPDGMVTQMKSASILYDRDGAGEFFQLYSRPFANGMFFEIVERRGGYSGFGAPNAPFRIAAQKRLLRAKSIPLE